MVPHQRVFLPITLHGLHDLYSKLPPSCISSSNFFNLPHPAYTLPPLLYQFRVCELLLKSLPSLSLHHTQLAKPQLCPCLMLTCMFEGKHTVSVFSLTLNSWTTKCKWALTSHYSLPALTLCSFLKNKTAHKYMAQHELLVSSAPIFLSLSLPTPLNCKSIILGTPAKTLQTSLTPLYFSKPETKVPGSFFKYVTDLPTCHNLPWQ